MAAKVTEDVLKRILQLKGIGLTDRVISIRLGISERTIRVYTRSSRTSTEPYRPDVPSKNSSEEIS
jgi:orotate phosphoribosyltransferase-like protein